MSTKIENLTDFKCWVKTQLVIQKTSQRAIAKKMNVAYPRITEAINGQPTGRKYIKPLIRELGGDIDDFKAILGSDVA